MSESWVEISFDCLPLRSVSRLDVPIDASPKYQGFCERVKAAIEKHGVHNTYYLHNARCCFHLLNDPVQGVVEFMFEGTALTCQEDVRCKVCDLEVKLDRETCDWLNQPVVEWFAETVPCAVTYEFNRYIDAGDLQRAKDRVAQIQQQCDDSGGFVGMYL